MKKFDIDGFSKRIFEIKFNNRLEIMDFISKTNFTLIESHEIEKYPRFAICIDFWERIALINDVESNRNYVNWSDYMNNKTEKPDLTENKKRNKLEVFKSITDNMYKTYEAKNNDYGDSFEKVRNKYPNSIVIRLNDKLNRLESLMNWNKQMVIEESIEDTLLDMANYCIMELVERKMEHEFRKKI